MRPLQYFLIVLFILLMGTTTYAQDSFLFENCPFPELDGVVCGYLTVPEDWSQPDGYTIELPVAIINPDSGNPVVYLEGGPGGAALLGTDSFLTSPVAEGRTVILFDQRGTGFALPSLNCWELELLEDDDPVAACRDRLLDEGIDLQMYNTAASAADVNELVKALGYDQVDLWGISYGTRLALTIMRDFPEIVRSAVLDSVYAPETDDLQVQIIGFMDAMDWLFERCAADAGCAAAYPELESDFYRLLNELDANPVDLDSEDEPITLDGPTFQSTLFNTLYDTEAIPFLPYAITLMANARNADDYLEGYNIIASIEFPVDVRAEPESLIAESDIVLDYMEEFGEIDDSEGMGFSVDCQEEYLLHDAQAALDLAQSMPEPLNRYYIDSILSSLGDCDIWGVEAAAGEDQRIVSDIPALLYAGMFDPITPVSSAESALEGLSNGRLLVFPSAGHAMTATETAAGECAAALMVAFLNNPNAPLDTVCIDETNVIDFYIE